MIELEDDLPPRRPRWLTRVVALLAAVLLLANLVRLGFDGGPAPDPSVAPSASIEPTLSPSGTPRVARPLAGMPPAIRRVAREVERIRGLRFLEPVEVQIVSQRRLDRRLRELVREALDPAEMARLGRTWTVLGLMDEGQSLLAAIEALHEGGVAGFYDDETKELLVETTSPDRLSPAARYYVAHELTHALTDQHHSLAPLRELAEGKGKSDQALAFRALVEGDAVLVAERYLRTYSASEIRALQAEIRAQNESALARVPGALLESFSFSYRAGTSFARHLHARGGFRAIDRAYDRPPRTTAEILEPTSYPAPAPARLPMNPPPMGWKVLAADAFGEFDLGLVLKRDPRRPAVPASVADEAADGWAGGRYRASGRNGETVVEIALAFEDAAEAQEAADAIDRYLAHRAGSSASAYENGAWTGRTGQVAGARLLDGERLRVLVATSERALDVHVER